MLKLSEPPKKYKNLEKISYLWENSERRGVHERYKCEKSLNLSLLKRYLNVRYSNPDKTFKLLNITLSSITGQLNGNLRKLNENKYERQ
jgi:hypothetical protein